MHSNRPYLLRAFYEWIVDNQCTPILVIDANNPRCKIPRDYAEGGEIVFNISSSAVRDLKMGNEYIDFKASFSGVIHFISVPVNAALAIYAEENSEGIFLDAEDDVESTSSDEVRGIREDRFDDSFEKGMTPKNASKTKPFLKLVE